MASEKLDVARGSSIQRGTAERGPSPQPSNPRPHPHGSFVWLLAAWLVCWFREAPAAGAHRRLPDASLAYQQGVVLRAPQQDLQCHTLRPLYGEAFHYEIVTQVIVNG